MPIPNAAFGYLLWQSFAATGLIERERVHAFAEKAMREAAQETSWAAPNEPFEQAVHAAVDAAYDRPEVRGVIESLSQRLLPYGWSNSLLQKVVQLTMPGVPDVYQGSERFEGSLVDPDNRRPVDFDQLAAALDLLERAGSGPSAFDTPSAKLWVTRHALHARRDHPELFSTYRPIVLEGALGEHLLAFDRGGAITLGDPSPGRTPTTRRVGRCDCAAPSGIYRDVLTGDRYEDAVDLGQLFVRYPVALLLLEN